MESEPKPSEPRCPECEDAFAEYISERDSGIEGGPAEDELNESHIAAADSMCSQCGYPAHPYHEFKAGWIASLKLLDRRVADAVLEEQKWFLGVIKKTKKRGMYIYGGEIDPELGAFLCKLENVVTIRMTIRARKQETDGA